MAWIDEQPLFNTQSNNGVYAHGDDNGKMYWFPSIMDQSSKKEDADNIALIDKQ